MSALASLNANITALALAVSAAIPDITPPVAGSGATEAQVQAAADAVAAQTALLNAAVLGATPGVPAAPVLNAPVNTAGIVSLTFTAVTGATSYNVKRGTAAGAETTVVSTTTPIFTEPTALPSGTYFYVVTAVNASGESKPSNEVTIAV